MARIRSIHPALFTDEAFVSLSPGAQILWIGLWCEADDQGVFEWKPTMLKMRILPASTSPIVPLLEELERADCIKSYAHEGRDYGVVRNFVKHQRPKSPKEVHPLPPRLRNYAGFKPNGSRPDATTGRKRFGTGSEASTHPGTPEFGTSSELRVGERGSDTESADADVPVGSADGGVGSEAVPNWALRCRMKDVEEGKSPSRGQGFQDGAAVAPSPAGAGGHTHERTREGRDPNGDDAFGAPLPLGSDDNAPLGRGAAAGGAR